MRGWPAAVAVLLLAGLAPAPAAAQDPARPSIAEGGEYSQNEGMGGAGAAIVADLSAIESNPAGMSQYHRYSVGGLGAQVPGGYKLGVSVLDSQSSIISMGVDYRYWRMNQSERLPERDAWRGGGDNRVRTRNDLVLAIGEYYEDKVYFGVNWRYNWWWEGHESESRNAYNFGAGVIVPATEWLRFGVASFDFVPFEDRFRDARIDLGTAIQYEEVLTIAVDGIWHWDQGPSAWELVTGAEAVILREVGVRLGWRKHLAAGAQSFHAGLGWIFEKGHIGYAFVHNPELGNTHMGSLEFNVF